MGDRSLGFLLLHPLLSPALAGSAFIFQLAGGAQSLPDISAPTPWAPNSVRFAHLGNVYICMHNSANNPANLKHTRMKTVCGMQRSGFVLPTPRLGGVARLRPLTLAFWGLRPLRVLRPPKDAEAGFVLVAS